MSYEPATAIDFCERLANGESLRSICKEEGMPDQRTIRRWLRDDAEFRLQYARARSMQAEVYAEEIIEISDDSSADYIVDGDGVPRFNAEAVARAKLRVDARKWIASKLLPKKYGERQIIEQEGEVKHYVLFGVPESPDALTWEAQNALP